MTVTPKFISVFLVLSVLVAVTNSIATKQDETGLTKNQASQVGPAKPTAQEKANLPNTDISTPSSINRKFERQRNGGIALTVVGGLLILGGATAIGIASSRDCHTEVTEDDDLTAIAGADLGCSFFLGREVT